MKKKNMIVIFMFASLSALGFLGCSSDDPSVDNSDPSPLSYEYLTANRSFMGGSLIYAPDDTTGEKSQIRAGTKIGVRLGKLKINTESVQVFPAGTASITSTGNHDTVEDSNGTGGASLDSLSPVSLTTNLSSLGGESADEDLYEDIPEQAEYGYLTVDSVSSDSISLTYTNVKSDNSSSSKSFSIKKGEAHDLNGSGLHNLRYDEPEIRRAGFGDNTRWLTFMNEDDALDTTLFYRFSESEVRSGYRAVVQSEAVDEGLYGVNSEGDFLYIFHGDNKNIHDTMAYGDYIICIPENTGLTEDNISSGESFSNPAINDASTNLNEFYDSLEALSSTDPTLNFGGISYVVTASSSGRSLMSSDEFENFEITYTYEIWQFPDGERGVENLFEDLGLDETILAQLNFSQNMTITEKLDRLNTLLGSEAFFTHIVDANILNDASLNHDMKYTWSTVSQDDKIRLCRNLLDEFYDASPHAVIDAPEIENIYPDLFVNTGSPESLNSDSYSGASNIVVDLQDSSRKVYSSYGNYKDRHDELQKEWKKFYSIDLSQVILYPVQKDKTRRIDPKTAGLNLSAGVKASVSIKNKHARVRLGVGVWLDVDLTLQSVERILDDIFGANAIIASGMEEKLNKLFGNNQNCEVKLSDVHLNVGGVPLVFGASVKAGFNFSFGSLNPHICFSGMYGGETEINADYGFRKKIKPYFKVKAKADHFNYTDLYFGIEDWNAPYTDITFEPWLKFNPSFGLGVSAVSVRASAPITVGGHSVFFLYGAGEYQNGGERFGIRDLGVFLSVYFIPYFEANLKIVKIKKNFATLKPVDHNLILYPEPVRFERRKDN